MEETEVVGDDVGEGEVGGQGGDPAQRLVSFVEGLGPEIGGDGQAALDRGKNQVIFDEGLHEGVALGKMGVLEALLGGNEVGDVESDHGEEGSLEHGVVESSGAEAGGEDRLGGGDRDAPGIEGDLGIIGLSRRGGAGHGRGNGQEERKVDSGQEGSFDQRGGGQGDARKEGD